MTRLTRDGTAEPVSRDQILRHARGQGNVHFPCSADHEQDWQPYPVDPYSAICDDHKAGRPGSSEVPRNPLTRWDVSSIPANVFFLLCLCVCFLPIHSGHPSSLDVPAGVTQTGERSHRISHPPSFSGACLNFSGDKGGSYGNKILYKNLDLTQDFPNKISFHFLWVKMLPKNLPKIFRWPEMCPLGKILA